MLKTKKQYGGTKNEMRSAGRGVSLAVLGSSLMLGIENTLDERIRESAGDPGASLNIRCLYVPHGWEADEDWGEWSIRSLGCEKVPALRLVTHIAVCGCV